MLGAPGDIAGLAENSLRGLIGKPQVQPWGGSEHIGQTLEQAGLVSDVRRPKTELLASLISPASAATAGYKAPQMARSGVQMMDNLSSAPTMARMGQRGAIETDMRGLQGMASGGDNASMIDYNSLIGKKFPFTRGASTTTATWDKSRLDEEIVDGVKGVMSDDDFAYNWLDGPMRREYLDLVENDIVSKYRASPEQALADFYIARDGGVSVNPAVLGNPYVDGYGQQIDKFMLGNKNVSKDLLREYAEYRKARSNKDIFGVTK
jgi:hypothetical protein